MNIIELNHVALHVADVAVSVAFYQDKLGLKQIPRPAFDFEGAWFQIGTTQALHLLSGSTSIVNGHSRTNHFAVGVLDIQTVDAFLTAKGIAHKPPKQRPDGIWQIFLNDPDGHCIEFCSLQ